MNIAPTPDALSQPFWDAVHAGRLVLQRCTACRTTVHPPQLLCPHCRTATLAWQDAPDGATVFACTVVHHAAHPAVREALPYVIVLATLEAGARMVLGLADPSADPSADAVRPGMRGRVVMRTSAQGITLPQFQPFSSTDPGDTHAE